MGQKQLTSAATASAGSAPQAPTSQPPTPQLGTPRASTLQATPADQYVLGSRGTAACAEGVEIRSKSGCEKALDALGIPKKEVKDNAPCYKDGKGDGYANGKNGGGAYFVCSKAPSPAPAPMAPLPPTAADQYILGSRGIAACAEGGEIRTKSGCEKALDALGIIKKEVKDNFPCYKDWKGYGYANG